MEVHEATLPTFGQRLGAALIDGFLLAPVVLVATQLVDLAVTGPLLVATYHLVATARWQRTLGKAAMGLRVVSIKGGTVGWRAAVVRVLALYGLGFVSMLWSGGLAPDSPLLALSSLFVVFRSDHRGLHDLAAGTIVLQAGPDGRLIGPAATAEGGDGDGR
jgi:uncharacterized RDD family membrane protein YckC